MKVCGRYSFKKFIREREYEIIGVRIDLNEVCGSLSSVTQKTGHLNNLNS
jgi:hypothetical protein